MNTITIQIERGPLSEADFGAYASLIAQLSPDRNVRKEHTDALYSSESDHVLCARNELGVIVGTARLHVRLEGEGCSGIVDDVVVNHTHRGQGIGRTLMERIHTLARELGLSWIELTSRRARVEAHKLYHSLGYTEENTAVFSKDLD